MSSSAGQLPTPQMTVYAATKVDRDGPFYFLWGEGLGQYEKNSCTAFVEEIKSCIAAGTKQGNLLQASEIIFIQSF